MSAAHCRYFPKLPKIVITFEFYPLHTKISTSTGTAISVEKVKEFRPVFMCGGNSTYPIPTVVPTGVVNDTKCEMSLPSVLVTFE